MPKKVLKFEIKNEYDFLLLAILCSHKDYRFCFELNNHLKLKLKREKDIELSDKHRNKNSFSSFYFSSSENEQIRVINNKSNAAAFIPEKKSIDFFIMVRNVNPKRSVDDLVNQIKKIKIVNGVYEMDPQTLKSAENFFIIE